MYHWCILILIKEVILCTKNDSNLLMNTCNFVLKTKSKLSFAVKRNRCVSPIQNWRKNTPYIWRLDPFFSKKIDLVFLAYHFWTSGHCEKKYKSLVLENDSWNNSTIPWQFRAKTMRGFSYNRFCYFVTLSIYWTCLMVANTAPHLEC